MCTWLFATIATLISIQLCLGNGYSPSDAFSGVQQNWMEQLVNNAALSDVSFIIGNERMKMYGIKALLANISPVLKQQLYDGANGDDNSEQCIEYVDISPNAFTSIIRGSLGINPNINDQNVREVMKASQLLQIDDLVTECQRYNSDKVKQRVKHVIVPGLLIVEGAFSHASVYNDIIWISGTIAAYVDEDGTNRLIDGGVKEQTVAILESIEKILNRSGSSFEYITNLRIFIDNNTSERYKEMNQAYVEFFQSRNVDVCARITVGAKGLALGADVEIDGSAVVP